MSNCPVSDLFDTNMVSSFEINDQFGTYPEHIRISGNVVSTSNTISDKTGTTTSLVVYDANNLSNAFAGKVISQSANIVSITSGSAGTQYLFDVTYSIGDVRWDWSKTHFTFNQSIDTNAFDEFVSNLKTVSNVNSIDYSTVDSAALNSYRSIQFDGTIIEAYEYLNRLTGKVAYYNPEANTVNLIDCNGLADTAIPSDACSISYDYNALDYNGVTVSGELNHIPATVNSVSGSQLPTKFVFPVDGWEFLGINGDAGLGLIPFETIGTDTVKNPDGSVTTIKHAGISFYAEAFLTYRWSPRGAILRDFSLSAKQAEQTTSGGTDHTYFWTYTPGNYTPTSTNKQEIKIVNQSDLTSNNLVDALNFKDADSNKYPEGFTEWFAVFQQSDDKQSQIISLICHKMWDLNYTMILQTDENGSTSGVSTIDYNNQIKPLIWKAVTDAKNFASKIEIDIDYGASIQTIFPYSVTIGSEPYVEITNNDVATINEATDFGNNFLSTATSKTLSYTNKTIESLDSAYTILSRTIRWDTSLEYPICEVVKKIG